MTEDQARTLIQKNLPIILLTFQTAETGTPACLFLSPGGLRIELHLNSATRNPANSLSIYALTGAQDFVWGNDDTPGAICKTLCQWLFDLVTPGL